MCVQEGVPEESRQWGWGGIISIHSHQMAIVVLAVVIFNLII